MTTGALGKTFQNGDVIIQQGDEGDCMYVIQEGQVEVLCEREGYEVRLAVVGEGDFIGEMSIFEKEVRSATVKAIGQVKVLTVDRKNFLRRVHEDPSLAYRLVEIMSHRIRAMNQELITMKSKQ